jgi:hypothetical protein
MTLVHLFGEICFSPHCLYYASRGEHWKQKCRIGITLGYISGRRMEIVSNWKWH